MSFKSVLDDIGSAFKKVFSTTVKVATAAEPFVDILFPGASTLFNGAVSVVSGIESDALAAGAQSGTGAQKAALAAPQIESLLNNYLVSNKIETPATAQQVTNVTNAVVAFLNELPTTATAQATPTTAVIAASTGAEATGGQQAAPTP